MVGWSLTLGRKLPRDWDCWVLFLTGGVGCPLVMDSCCISELSVTWWTMRVPSRGPLVFATSGGCRGFSIQTSSLCYHCTLVTATFMRIWESVFCRPHQSPNWEFRPKLADAGNLVARQIFTLARRGSLSCKQMLLRLWNECWCSDVCGFEATCSGSMLLYHAHYTSVVCTSVESGSSHKKSNLKWDRLQ